MTTITIENANKLIEYSKQGLNKVEAGKKLKISDRQVLRILNKFNLKEKYDNNLKSFISNEYYTNIIQLYLKGLTINLISHEINRKEEFVCENLHRAFNEKIIKAALCEKDNCNNINDYSYSKGRFCSKECARSFSTKDLTDEQKELRNNGLAKGNKKKVEKWAEWQIEREINPNAEKPFYLPVLKDSENYEEVREKISNSHKKLWEDPSFRESQLANRSPMTDETRKKLSDNAKKAMAEGRIKSWATRGRAVQSYPEKFWTNVLNNHLIPFQREFKILHKDLNMESSSFYFLDFVIKIGDFIIDLEIDGKQHKYKDRIKSDKIRDEALSNNDYIVYRIDWINPNNYKNKKIVEEQIKDFVNFLNQICEFEGLSHFPLEPISN